MVVISASSARGTDAPWEEDWLPDDPHADFQRQLAAARAAEIEDLRTKTWKDRRGIKGWDEVNLKEWMNCRRSPADGLKLPPANITMV